MAILLLLTLHLAHAATPAAPIPANLTEILTEGGQYTTFIRLLNHTQVSSQIQSQLNNSFNGLTVFAPTDTAFNNLEPGKINSLTPQQQVTLVLYHVLPKFYNFATFQTASNPVPTQASGPSEVYTINITIGMNQQVNVSSNGGSVTRVGNELYSEFPLGVYSVDEVLMPIDDQMVRAPPPVAAPRGVAPLGR